MKWALGRKWDFCCCKSTSPQSWEHVECRYWLHALCASLEEERACALFYSRVATAFCHALLFPNLDIMLLTSTKSREAGSCGLWQACGPQATDVDPSLVFCSSEVCCFTVTENKVWCWLLGSKENSGEWQGLRKPSINKRRTKSDAWEITSFSMERHEIHSQTYTKFKEKRPNQESCVCVLKNDIQVGLADLYQ